MKKIFLVSILGLSAIFSAACWSSEAENINNNANENVNANVAEQKPTDVVPEYTGALTALEEGNKFFDANQTEKAIEAYKQATKLDPDLAEAHFRLGIAYALLESEQELIATPVEPVNTDEKPEKDKKGKKDDKEKKEKSVLAFENAVTAYKKILKEDPKDHVSHYNLGRTYDRLNEDEDARKSLEAAVKLEPENTLYQTELGAILIKLAQYDEAVRALKKAVQLDDGNIIAQELLEDAEAGKKRVDFGADKLKDSLKTSTQEPQRSSRSGRKNDSDKDDSAEPEKKEPEKKEPEKKKDTPKPVSSQPKKPASSNLE